MKSYKAPTNILLIFFFTLLLMGCYESPVPLSPVEEAELDYRLQGRWKNVNPDDPEANGYILAIPFNRNAYYIEYCCEEDESLVNSEEVDTLRFSMFTTMVDGVPFANIQPLSLEEDHDEASPFLLIQYGFSPSGELTFRTVSEDLFEIKFETSEALYSFVRQNMNNEKLYMDDGDDEVILFRKVE